MLLPTYTGVPERGAVGGVGVARQLLCTVSMETFVQLEYTFGSIINYILRVFQHVGIVAPRRQCGFLEYLCFVWNKRASKAGGKQGKAGAATPNVEAFGLFQQNKKKLN